MVLSMGSNYQSIAQIEKELKEFWNNLIEKEGGNNHPPSQDQPDKNSNKNSKNPNNKVNWAVKSLVVFLVVILLLGGVVAIRDFVRDKRK